MDELHRSLEHSIRHHNSSFIQPSTNDGSRPDGSAKFRLSKLHTTDRVSMLFSVKVLLPADKET
jgi:hypothetical protein